MHKPVILKGSTVATEENKAEAEAEQKQSAVKNIVHVVEDETLISIALKSDE